LSSLQRIEQKRDWQKAGAAGLEPFEDYEQLSTLFDVLGARNRTEAPALLIAFRQKVSRLLSARKLQSKNTVQLRDLFRKLSEEALRRSKQPAQEVSRRALELCRQK
jgi:hypothetical protein